MFDQILDLVKSQLGSNQDVAQQIPAGKADQVHQEVAAHVNNGIKNRLHNMVLAVCCHH